MAEWAQYRVGWHRGGAAPDRRFVAMADWLVGVTCRGSCSAQEANRDGDTALHRTALRCAGCLAVDLAGTANEPNGQQRTERLITLARSARSSTTTSDASTLHDNERSARASLTHRPTDDDTADDATAAAAAVAAMGLLIGKMFSKLFGQRMACAIVAVHTAVQHTCDHAATSADRPAGWGSQRQAWAAGLGCCGCEPLCSGAIRSQRTGLGSLLTRHLCVCSLWCRDRCW